MKASQLRNEVECHEIYKEIHIIDSSLNANCLLELRKLQMHLSLREVGVKSICS